MTDMKLRKVTMNLTYRDIENTASLSRRLHSRTKASAVSSALAIAEGITKRIAHGEEVLIRRKDGSVERMFIAGVGGD